MESVVAPFLPLIADWDVIDRAETVNISYRKATIAFIDGSMLAIFEKLHRRNNHYRYGYQWLAADNQLIIRWDNALHYAHIPTFPHHQHVGSEENVQPSEPMTLEKVLTFIASQLT
jgi:hypothetical protein